MEVPQFTLIDPPPFWTVAASALAGICIEIGAAFANSSHPISGTLLIAGGLGLLYWKLGLVVQELIRNFRVRVHLGPSLLMVILALIGFRPVLHNALGGGGSPATTITKDPEENASELLLSQPGQGRPSPDTQPGVVLMTETKPHPVLIPPMPAIGTGTYLVEPSKPLSIPFYGVYHFFRKRDLRLPRNSVQREGSPAVLRFRSTDGTPIVMEAHQNLGTFIDVACCRSIEVGITSTDPYFASVGMELVLVNTELKHTQSLGRVAVENSPSQVLVFPLAGSPELARFDEITVKFHLAFQRAERSAKVAIEKFVLIPRG